MKIGGESDYDVFLLIEILKINIVDWKINGCIEGIVGNNFFLYVWDYDFSVVLLYYNKDWFIFGVLDNFGDLYGKLFKLFLNL